MIATSPRKAHYFYRLREDNFIGEFCVAGHCGEQVVETTAPDGKTRQKWPSHFEGDLLVFTPPDGYGGGPIRWKYNKFLQDGQPMPREEMEKRALNMRVSVNF